MCISIYNREQTVYTKILSEYAMLIGKRYLEMVLGPVIKQMAEVAEPEGISFEVKEPNLSCHNSRT